MKLHLYQSRAVLHVLQHPHAMLHLDMGLGKTVISLTAFTWLQQFSVVRSALVVAPKRPARIVWESEARKWEHTKHLRFCYVLGNAKERLRALFRPADIYVINYENLAWLRVQLEGYFLTRGTYLPFQMIMWDEISKMKNASTERVKRFTDIMPYLTHRLGLTGTPASNGLQDLHGQFLMVDNGARLGVSKDGFLRTFFKQNAYSYKLEIDQGGRQRIAELISDITLQMRAEDYLTVPQLVVNDIWVTLPPKVREAYDKLETEFFLELDNGVEIDVFNEASKVNKCLQVADGAVYLRPGEPLFEPLHSEKIDAWEELRAEIGDSSLLSSYRFRFTVSLLQNRFPTLHNMSASTEKESQQWELEFNNGTLKDLLGHPASIGHGLNLQEQCHHICMIGCVWSLDLYHQFIARIRRQGQKNNRVILHRILAADTMDEVVIERLTHKEQDQEDLRRTITEYRNKRENRVCQPQVNFL